MRRRLVLTYPNLLWLKFDPVTTWNLSPATLCQLGAVARDVVDVSVVDGQFLNLSIDEYAEKVTENDPDFVGVSLLSSEYGQALHIAAEAIKKRKPDTIIIAGGVHVTKEYEQVIADETIDYAVRGDGEYVLRDLLAHLCGEGPMPETGVVYRDGEKVVTLPQAIVENLEDLPMPDYGLFDMADFARRAYAYRLGPTNPPELPGVRITITRGCPLECSFCQVKLISGARIRARNADQVVEELTLLKDRYGVKSVIFDDDNLISSKRYFKDLLSRMIDARLGIKFTVGAFALFSLDDEMLDLLAEAGCVGMNIAIESGSQRVLDEIVRKPIKLQTVPEWIRKIKAKGIFIASNFMLGFPGETWDEIRQTVHFAETCGAEYVKFFMATPLPGTALWEMAEKQGVLKISKKPQGKYERWGSRSGHGTAEIISDEWTPEDIRILRAYEWDRINFGDPVKRRRTIEIWKSDEETINRIRKDTRDSITFGSRGRH